MQPKPVSKQRPMRPILINHSVLRVHPRLHGIPMRVQKPMRTAEHLPKRRHMRSSKHLRHSTPIQMRLRDQLQRQQLRDQPKHAMHAIHVLQPRQLLQRPDNQPDILHVPTALHRQPMRELIQPVFQRQRLLSLFKLSLMLHRHEQTP